jgi:uncharacterized protein (DUF1800 family)
MNWSPYQPTADAPWNLRRVVHLHRRAGFAASWSVIQRDLGAGPDASVSRLLNGNAVDAPNDLDAMAETIGDAAIASSNPQRLKAWWLYRMVTTSDPLGERLALMWHNHFATSNRKVKDLRLMRDQNELFRRYGRGQFGELLSSVVKHPAMMLWLDADSNRKGKANENLAREMLELFTLGVGEFTETDVKESARALTGWSVIGDRFENRKARHDDGELTILGKTQPFDGDQLLKMLLGHPSTAKRLAWRLCKTFMGEGVVSETAANDLADGLTEHNLNLGWAIETVLRSELFFSDANIGSRVLGPIEYIVGAIRCLELNETPPSSMILAQWSERIGQDLFYPPNVGGWNEGRSWLNSRSIIARANFANALSTGQLWHPARVPSLDQLADRHGADPNERIKWLATLLWGEAPGDVVEETVSKMNSMKDASLPEAASLLLSRAEHQLG